LAVAAVISYELSEKAAVQFPRPTKEQVKAVPKELVKELRKYGWRARRVGDREQYQFMGCTFDHSLQTLPEQVKNGFIHVNINDIYRRMGT
jgi:hypothetical protein